MPSTLPAVDYATIRQALLDKKEIALLDVREEDPHAQAHPLFAANFPLARIELNAYARLPRRDVFIVTFDGGEDNGDAGRAALKLRELGYSNVHRFVGGPAAWAAAGGELFRDVNVPSKAFGELVESVRHTPSLSAEEVQALIDRQGDVVIVDARRFDEYQTMSIPTATSVPGAELVLRLPALAPDPRTQVIVNCAGRTRSIIGTQSLINAGLPNPVAALRNGTIGWTLAGQALEHGQARRFKPVDAASRQASAAAARRVADRAGVHRTDLPAVEDWRSQQGRTSYFIDVRTPEEYRAGHLPGFIPVAGGQLVQETEMVAPVRGGRIVLADDDGVRANMSASWLAQMGWEVHVIDHLQPSDFSEAGDWLPPLPPRPGFFSVLAGSLAERLNGDTVVIDLSTAAAYRRGHIPGAWFVQRSGLAAALASIPRQNHWVLTSEDGTLAAFTVPEMQALVAGSVHVLSGGNQAWQAAGLPLETGDNRLASAPTDRYRRPYEGTDNPRAAMQGYLDWEFGLVEQLGRDGTHGFRVI